MIILYFTIKSPARLLLELRGLQSTLSTVSSLLRFIPIYSSTAVNELITTRSNRKHRISFTNILLSFLVLSIYAWHCCLKDSWDWCPLYCMLYTHVMNGGTCSENLILFKKKNVGGKNRGGREKESKAESRRHKGPLPKTNTKQARDSPKNIIISQNFQSINLFSKLHYLQLQVLLNSKLMTNLQIKWL